MSRSMLKFYKELRKVALKHGLVLAVQCLYCQRSEDTPCEHEVHHFFTVVQKRRKR